MVSYSKCKRGLALKKQQGNILVMFTIGLFVLIAMAALAIDSGHLLLNKSRLQNITDAAALHAAKTVDSGGSHIDARAAVIEILVLNLAHRDNFEIRDALNLSAVDTSATQVTAQINVDFSEKADPFIHSDDAQKARYVKVEIGNLNLNNFLADIMNFSKRIAAASLAGPSTAVVECPKELVPMLVCASDPSDIPVPGGSTMYGLPFNQLYAMKIGSNTDSPIGAGNFQLIRLGENSGAADIRAAMAGEAFDDGETCFSSEGPDSLISTEPGNTVGPSAQGINTRLGSWQGPVNKNDHPRDWNICQGPQVTLDENGAISTETQGNAYLYSQYQADTQAHLDTGQTRCSDLDNPALAVDGDIDSTAPNVNERRILNVVIGDCTGKNHGASDIPYLGLGCFFLTQDMDAGGQDAFLVGEFLYDCSVEGFPSGVAVNNPGPYTIVLYHVPESKDS